MTKAIPQRLHLAFGGALVDLSLPRPTDMDKRHAAGIVPNSAASRPSADDARLRHEEAARSATGDLGT